MSDNKQQSNPAYENSIKEVSYSAFIECLADLLIAEKDPKRIDKDNSE